MRPSPLGCVIKKKLCFSMLSPLMKVENDDVEHTTHGSRFTAKIVKVDRKRASNF